ncbi:MAG: sensor histidine kinase [Saprospiraceae bacterium]
MQAFKRHAIYWLFVYFLWTYLKSYGHVNSSSFIVTLAYAPIHIMVYYLLAEFQIPRYYNKGKVGLFFLSLLLSSFAMLMFWSYGMSLVNYILLGQFRFVKMSLVAYILEAVQFYSPAVALLAWETYHKRQEEAERVDELEKENMRAELKLLKAQLNPHFLFNTLQHLHTNVIKKSPEAPDMILQLSGILDYVLYKSQNKLVTLQEEIKAIDNFLKLEKIRLGERVKIDFKHTDSSAALVSPLILLSLVEHVFKFINFEKVNFSNVEITINESSSRIYCELIYVKNKTEQTTEEITSWANIKKQLELTYPGRYELSKLMESESSRIILHLEEESR